jgi:hypothetical protein
VGTAEDGVRVLILLGIFEGLHEQRPPHRQPAVVWDPKREVDDGSTSGLKKPKPEVEEAAWTPPPECRAGQLRFAAADPEDFPSQQARMLTSFNDELPATDDFAEAWSRSEAKKEAAEPARYLNIVVEVEDSPLCYPSRPRLQLRRAAAAEGGAQGRELRRRRRLHHLL